MKNGMHKILGYNVMVEDGKVIYVNFVENGNEFVSFPHYSSNKYDDVYWKASVSTFKRKVLTGEVLFHI